MAESVDALVSNTSGATHPGSTPGLGTEAGKVEKLSPFSFLPRLTHWLYWLVTVSHTAKRFLMGLTRVLLQQHNHLQCEVKEHHLGIDVLFDVPLGFAQFVHDAENVLLVHEGGKA